MKAVLHISLFGHLIKLPQVFSATPLTTEFTVNCVHSKSNISASYPFTELLVVV